MQAIRVGDDGTVIRVTLRDQDGGLLNPASATTRHIILRKPNGTSLTKTASLYTDGTDGKLTYTLIDGDIEIAGRWEISVYLDFSNGEWTSTIGEFLAY